MNKKDLEGYYREIQKNLVGARKEKAEYLRGFRKEIDDYIEIHPDCTMKELSLQFGDPEEIGNSLLTNEEAVEFWKKAKMKKLCRRIFIAFLVGCAVVLIGLFAYRVWDMYNFHNGHYEVTIAEGLSSKDPEALDIY